MCHFKMKCVYVCVVVVVVIVVDWKAIYQNCNSGY